MRKLAIAVMSLCLIFVAACGSAGNNEAADNKAASEGNKETATNAAQEETKTEDAKPVKLRIYSQYADDDTKLPYDYAVAELKKEMPNVELELEVQAQDDGQKLKTYAATGNLPDIFQAGLDIITTFKKSGNILELDAYVDELGYKDKMFPSTMNTLVAEDGHTYAFPYHPKGT